MGRDPVVPALVSKHVNPEMVNGSRGPGCAANWTFPIEFTRWRPEGRIVTINLRGILMQYDIYRRDNLMLVFETGRPPSDMNLGGWKRLHMGVDSRLLTDRTKSANTKPIAQIDREIKQNGMTTFQITHVSRAG